MKWSYSVLSSVSRTFVCFSLAITKIICSAKKSVLLLNKDYLIPCQKEGLPAQLACRQSLAQRCVERTYSPLMTTAAIISVETTSAQKSGIFLKGEVRQLGSVLEWRLRMLSI